MLMIASEPKSLFKSILKSRESNAAVPRAKSLGQHEARKANTCSALLHVHRYVFGLFVKSEFREGALLEKMHVVPRCRFKKR